MPGRLSAVRFLANGQGVLFDRDGQEVCDIPASVVFGHIHILFDIRDKARDVYIADIRRACHQDRAGLG